MDKKTKVTFTLVGILILLAASFLALLRWQRKLEERRLLTYQLGISLYGEGKYEEAIQQFQEIIERYPESKEAVESCYKIGLALSELSRYAEAANYFQRLLGEFPGDDYREEARYQLGLIAEKQGDLGKSLSIYQKLATDFPHGRVTDQVLLSMGRIYEKSRKWKEARKYYQKVIDDFPNRPSFTRAMAALGNLNIELIFSPALTAESVVYEVVEGDSLHSIARRYNTTVSLIMKSNRLKSSLIRPGMTLKITPGKYHIVIDKSDCTLTLYLNDKFIKKYPVGIGVEDYYTPTGEFKIINKQKDPVWYHGGRAIPPEDPDNILGTRWMGISSPGYGIHGTTQPETIGKRSSQGCIRMFNKDVEELYDLVTIGTPVTIVD